jgi:hypothetical protein
VGVQVPPFAPKAIGPESRQRPRKLMSQPNQPAEPPTVKTKPTEHYRESYANSVQVRMSVWDFFLVFGTMHQESADSISIENFQGIYLSPQQAKALLNVLGHNLAQYEKTFGALALEPQFLPAGGPVH